MDGRFRCFGGFVWVLMGLFFLFKGFLSVVVMVLLYV